MIKLFTIDLRAVPATGVRPPASAVLPLVPIHFLHLIDRGTASNRVACVRRLAAIFLGFIVQS